MNCISRLKKYTAEIFYTHSLYSIYNFRENSFSLSQILRSMRNTHARLHINTSNKHYIPTQKRVLGFFFENLYAQTRYLDLIIKS